MQHAPALLLNLLLKSAYCVYSWKWFLCVIHCVMLLQRVCCPSLVRDWGGFWIWMNICWIFLRMSVLLLSPVVLYNKSVQCLIAGCLISLNTDRSAVLTTYLFTDMSTNQKMRQKWAQIHSSANTLLYTLHISIHIC